jgi:glycosyltransferase involved in cell wall biosynthesis
MLTYSARRDDQRVIGGKPAIRGRIAVVHPERTSGGDQAVLAWTLEGLKDSYDLTTVTSAPLDLDSLNRTYGTLLRGEEFQQQLLPWWLRPIAARRRLAIFTRYLTMRYCRSLRRRFDLFIGLQNETDVGTKCVQYIHFPIESELGCNMRAQNQVPDRLAYRMFYGHAWFRKSCKAVLRLIADYSEKRIRENISLVNSEWTGAVVQAAYGVRSRVVYPPVPNGFDPVAWEERENGFVCVGRIAPEKRIERIIAILAQVREEGWEIHLHIVGAEDWDQQYAQKIKALQARHASWVFLEGHVPRTELVALLSHHKYGIHGYEAEQFGIVVAEMVKAGCIVFVPNGGGQVEIVRPSQLAYDSVDDAVRKITDVLSGKTPQKHLLQELSRTAQKFSAENFASSMREVVAEFLERRPQCRA